MTGIERYFYPEIFAMNFSATLQYYVSSALPYSERSFQPLTKPAFGAVCGTLAATIIAALLAEPFIGLAVVGVGILGVVLTVFIRHPRLWLYVVVLTLPLWFPQKGDSDSGISIIEYAMVGFYIGGLALWFVIMWFVRRQKLIRNAGDMLFLLVMVFLTANFFIALANDVEPLMWFRDWLLFVFLLYYFPFREHLTTKRDVIIFSIVLCIAMSIVGGMTVQRYIQASTNIAYAFEIVSSRQNTNNNMSVVLSIFALFAALYTRQWWQRFLTLGVAVFFTSLTVISFARAFVLATIISVVGTLLLLDTKRLARFVVFGALMAALFVGGVSLVFGDKAQIALKILGVRIGSTSQGTQDRSLQSRISESIVMLKATRDHPLGGNGLGVGFIFYDPIGNTHLHVKFVHNGYIFIIYKFGLPIFVLLYGWYLFYAARAYLLVRAAVEPFDRILALAAVACLIALLTINVTSSIFEVRDGFFMLAFIIAICGIVERRLETTTGYVMDERLDALLLIGILGSLTALAVGVLVLVHLFL